MCAATHFDGYVWLQPRRLICTASVPSDQSRAMPPKARAQATKKAAAKPTKKDGDKAEAKPTKKAAAKPTKKDGDKAAAKKRPAAAGRKQPSEEADAEGDLNHKAGFKRRSFQGRYALPPEKEGGVTIYGRRSGQKTWWPRLRAFIADYKAGKFLTVQADDTPEGFDPMGTTEWGAGRGAAPGGGPRGGEP